MRIGAIIAAIAFALAGCAHESQSPEPVTVSVQGPKFPASALECGNEPMPPDPAAVGNHAAAAAARYETRLSGWGNGCRLKLKSVGSQLRSAGQVVE